MAVHLGVVTTNGEVWDRIMGPTSVGEGTKLQGPSIFGGPDTKFVIGGIDSDPSVTVVTNSGAVWEHTVTIDGNILPGNNLNMTLFGSNDAIAAVLSTSAGFLVVTAQGDVVLHSASGGTPVVQLNGPSIFGGPNTKYIVFDPGNPASSTTSRVLVINTQGEVWAHDLMKSNLNVVAPWDSIGPGHKLNGPSLFGGPNDKYVVVVAGLQVINTAGEVWTRSLDQTTVGAGQKMSGPSLFGGPNDLAVVAYEVFPPPP